MSNELQSLKYMSAEFLAEIENQNQPQSSVQVQSPGLESPYVPPMGSTHHQVGVASEAGRWTGTMSFIAGFMSFAGGIGVVQGLWGLWGLVNMESQVETLSQMSYRMPELKDTVAMMQAQMANWNLLMVSVVVGLVVSIGFIFSSYMYKNRKENGHVLMAVFCGFAILFHLLTAYVTYLSLEAMPTFQQGPNGQAALNVAMGAVGFIILIKCAIYLAIAAHMFNRNSKAVFAPPVLEPQVSTPPVAV